MAPKNSVMLCVLVAVVWTIYIFSYVSSPRPEQPKLRSTRLITPPFEEAEPVDYRDSPAWKNYLMTAKFTPSFTDLKNNFGYCDLVKQYRRWNPIRLDAQGLPIWEDRVVYNNYPNWYSVKKIFNQTHPLVLYNYVDDGKGLELAEFPYDITVFFTMTIDFHKHFEIGRSFLCDGQRYNHIPGNVQLDSKIQSIVDLKQYSKYYASRRQCFSLWQCVPYTLLLNDFDGVQEFTASLKANIEDPAIKWIVKQGEQSSQGVGVTVVDQSLAQSIIFDVEERSLHSQFKSYVAQQYMENPFLIEGRKSDLRTYLFIASMDPPLAFVHDGYLRIALADFDTESNISVAHVTTAHRAIEYLRAANYTSDDVSSMLNQNAWMYDDIEKYLLEKKLVQPGWMENQFRRQIREITLHVLRAGFHNLLKHPRVFELFGLDFLIDDQLNLKFIELNYDPGLINSTPGKEVLNNKLLKGIMDIEYALEFKPELLDEVVSQTEFQWILDGRKQGIERYAGLLSEDCL